MSLMRYPFACWMICAIMYTFMCDYATADDGYFYSVEVEPLKYAPGNKMAVSGGVTAGEVNRNTGAGYQGNQNTANDQLLGSVVVSPTPTSISPETGCHYEMDLALVLDSSHTITSDGWSKMKEAAKRLVKGLDVSSDGTHVSILVYSTDVDNFYMFDKNAEKGKLSRLIDGLTYYGEWSRLDIALGAVLHHVFLPLSGARRDVPKVVAVFTDGKLDAAATKPGEHRDWIKAVADPIEGLRKDNVTMFGVATEASNYEVLNLIGGDRSRVINITSIDKLVESLFRVSKKVCPVQPPPVKEDKKNKDVPSFTEEESTTTVTTTTTVMVTVTAGESYTSTSANQITSTGTLPTANQVTSTGTLPTANQVTSTNTISLPTANQVSATNTISETTAATSKAATITETVNTYVTVTASIATTIVATSSTSTQETSSIEPTTLQTPTTVVISTSSLTATASTSQTIRTQETSSLKPTAMVTPTTTVTATPSALAVTPVADASQDHQTKRNTQPRTRLVKRAKLTDYIPKIFKKWMAIRH